MDRCCFEDIATAWRDNCMYIQYYRVETSPVFAVVTSDVGRNELQSGANIRRASDAREAREQPESARGK